MNQFFADRLALFVRQAEWSQDVRSQIVGYDNETEFNFRYTATNEPTYGGISIPSTKFLRKRTRREALDRLESIEIPIPPTLRRAHPLLTPLEIAYALAKVLIYIDPLNRLEG